MSDTTAATMSSVTTQDRFPTRPRARRELGGTSPSGITLKATAYADPLPDSLGYGSFYGEGQISLERRGLYILSNMRFEEIPEVIALLQELLAAASAPAVAP